MLENVNVTFLYQRNARLKVFVRLALAAYKTSRRKDDNQQQPRDYKGLEDTTPDYINSITKTNSEFHNRSTRFSKLNFYCPV